MTITDPRLARETTRVPRRSDYEKRPVLSATIHPDIKKTLVSMSERTGMSVSQVTDAMQDPRYDKDPAYRKKVTDKLARSTVI